MTTRRAARTSTTSAEDKAHARRELAERLHTSITEQVAALVDSASWRAYLDHMAAFHSYSFNNVLLILAQRATATQVAGFRAWQNLGRQVRKGEKAIRIYGYSTRTVTDTDQATGDETTRKVPTFPILSVFAHDQTDPIDGHPQAEDIAHRLHGDDPDAIAARVAEVMTTRGWTVTRDLIDGETNGYTTVDGTRRIVVDARLSPAQTAKTMIHEAAHALMHSTDVVTQEDRAAMHRGRMEVEAESVAYVLAGILGLDTAAYSVGYVAGWANGDTTTVADTARAVLATVHELADALDPRENTTSTNDTGTSDTGTSDTGSGDTAAA